MLDTRERLREVLRREVNVAPIAFGPSAVAGQCAGEAALVERHARDDRDVQLAAHREQLVFRILVEDVVNDLNTVDQAAAQSREDVRRFPTVDADSEAFDKALPFQVVDRSLPAFVAHPGIAPHVKLLQVDRRGA
jgi:hypothetical protein